MFYKLIHVPPPPMRRLWRRASTSTPGFSRWREHCSGLLDELPRGASKVTVRVVFPPAPGPLTRMLEWVEALFLLEGYAPRGGGFILEGRIGSTTDNKVQIDVFVHDPDRLQAIANELSGATGVAA